MEKERRTKALVVVVLLIVVAGLTVAFAALSATLNINGTAYLDAAKWGIRFENLSSPTKIGSATTTGTAKIEELPEDEGKRAQEEVQDLINKYNKIVDEKLKAKEEELMSI